MFKILILLNTKINIKNIDIYIDTKMTKKAFKSRDPCKEYRAAQNEMFPHTVFYETGMDRSRLDRLVHTRWPLVLSVYIIDVSSNAAGWRAHAL